MREGSGDEELPSLKGPLPGPDDTSARPPRWKRWARWFTLGIGIKRWALLAVLGLALAAWGALLAAAYLAVEWSVTLVEEFSLRTGRVLNTEALGVALLLAGFVCVMVGTRGVMKAVERAYAASGQVKEGFLETALRQKQLEGKEKIVALGGGTGLSTMLRGLKSYSSNITAIVTMADDGGSSGMLREHGMLPPGDLRNCIAALAESEPLMINLFQHRFEGLGALKGHSVGNLIMAAMCEMEGDYEKAVQATSKVLAIRGRVLPSTLENIRMGATLHDGTEVLGQKHVSQAPGIARAFLIPDSPRALPAVVKAIEEAEIIIIGPGSLFTSLIPNLLVPEIAAAIKKSKAPKVYVCNVMTQPRETSGFKASDHVAAIIRHIGAGVITHALVNSSRPMPEALAKYEAAGAQFVEPDEVSIEMLGVEPIPGNLMDDSILVRHNPPRLAARIFKIITSA